MHDIRGIGSSRDLLVVTRHVQGERARAFGSLTRLSDKGKALIGVDFSCNEEGYHRPSHQNKYTKNVQNRSRTIIINQI